MIDGRRINEGGEVAPTWGGAWPLVESVEEKKREERKKRRDWEEK